MLSTILGNNDIIGSKTKEVSFSRSLKSTWMKDVQTDVHKVNKVICTPEFDGDSQKECVCSYTKIGQGTTLWEGGFVIKLLRKQVMGI